MHMEPRGPASHFLVAGLPLTLLCPSERLPICTTRRALAALPLYAGYANVVPTAASPPAPPVARSWPPLPASAPCGPLGKTSGSSCRACSSAGSSSARHSDTAPTCTYMWGHAEQGQRTEGQGARRGGRSYVRRGIQGGKGPKSHTCTSGAQGDTASQQDGQGAWWAVGSG